MYSGRVKRGRAVKVTAYDATSIRAPFHGRRTLGYSWALADSLLKETYPSGRQITFGVWECELSAVCGRDLWEWEHDLPGLAGFWELWRGGTVVWAEQ